MKRLLSIGILALLFSSCNDGDIVYKELNFENQAVQKCYDKDLYYKINAKDMMILKVDPNLLIDSNLILGEEKTFEIGSSLELIYRTYDENADSKSICESLPPAKPVVVSEMMANPGGTALITRDLRIQKNDLITEPTVLNYFYTINFRDISFKDGETNINQTKLYFGEYKYKTNNLTFNFDGIIKFCDEIEATRLVVNSATEAMVLNIPEDALKNEEKTVSFNLSDTNNLTYKAYTISGGAIDQIKACSDETVFGETIQIENWNASTGTLKVVTSKVIQPENNPEQKVEYLHKLSLENVVFTKEGKSFVRDVVPFGEITIQL